MTYKMYLTKVRFNKYKLDNLYIFYIYLKTI